MAEGRPNLRGETPYWNDVTVKTILRNEVYLGHMVQNKTGTVSYKVHKKVCSPAWYTVQTVGVNYTSPLAKVLTVHKTITAVPTIKAIREAVRRV